MHLSVSSNHHAELGGHLQTMMMCILIGSPDIYIFQCLCVHGRVILTWILWKQCVKSQTATTFCASSMFLWSQWQMF